MAYRIEKETGDLIFSGWELGIAPSPHKGIGDLKNVNISSLPGEAAVNYARTKQSQYLTVTNSLAPVASNVLNALAGSGQLIGLLHGTWITITSSSITNLTNGNSYYVKSSTSGNITLSTTYEGSIINTFGLTGSATFSVIGMGRPVGYASTNSSRYPDYDYFILDSNGYVWYKAGTAAATWLMIANSVSDKVASTSGIFCFGSYVIIVADKLYYKSLGSLGTAWSSFGANVNQTSATHTAIVSHNSVAYWCDGSAVSSLAHGVGTFDPTSSATYTQSIAALRLPLEDAAQYIAEIGTGAQTTLLIGGQLSVLYPWDGLATTYGALIYLAESSTTQMVSVNNLVYVFCGSKGNVYVTNGSSATAVMTVPDYVANNQGGNQDPYFIWGGAMYLRGRVWFSVQAPNCGGIWSFVPTINYYVSEDTGASLRMENKNAYGTFSGMAVLLFPAMATTSQQANGPQYYSAWDDGTSGASLNPYGIDYSGTAPFIDGAIIETDLAPTGTLLKKKTFEQLEYKLSRPLVAGESVQLYYRQNLTDAFATCGTVNVESATGLSGYFTANFQNGQWLQLRAVLTAVASNSSFVPLVDIRVR